MHWSPSLRSLFAVALLTLPAASGAAEIADFFGSYVGTAVVRTKGEDKVERRDVDIVIEPERSGGFTIRWINVTLVDGRRDVPGVERQENRIAFLPAASGAHFVESSAYNPFEQQEEIAPMAGDPLRWAALDDRNLFVYSFVILSDGRYELQTYTRSLSNVGIALSFERIVDGDVIRRIEGHAVRAE